MSLLPSFGGAAAVGLAPVLKPIGNLDAGRLLRKTLGLDRFGIDQVREIEWRKSYLWNFKFIQTPNNPVPTKPFVNFIPADTIRETVATLREETFEVPGGVIAIPRKADLRTISLTYYDDEPNTLFNFFRSWYNSILGAGVVVPLSSAVKMVTINRLNSYQEVIGTSAYWVFPKGNLEWEGNSASEASKYSVELIICSEVKWTETSSGTNWKAALQDGYSFLSNASGSLYPKIIK